MATAAQKQKAAQRQTAFRNKMRDQGFEAVTVWVPAHQAAQLALIAKAMLADPDLEFGNTLRHGPSGRIKKVL